MPPSSVLAGPTGPVTCRQDLPPPASLPVLAGSQDLAGVLPVPPPPEGPYDAFLLCTGRLKQDSAALVLQPAATVPPQDLMTLPAALPRPFLTFKGPVLTPRDPSPAPRLCMLLPGRSYVPPPQAWSWPGRGSAVPDLNRHLLQPVPPRPDAGAASNAFLSTVGRPPTPHPHQLTTGSVVQTPPSYPPALGRIFSSPRPASLPGSAGPAYPQSKPGLATGLQIPVPPASSSSASAPLPAPSQSDVASLPAATSTLTAPPDVQAMMKDWQDAFFKTMQDRMQILMGDAPPQPTAGFSIPQRKMDPNELWQLSPSGGREASWAQHKSGTKRAGGCSRSRSPSGDRSEASRDSRSCAGDSSASSSPPSKLLRADSSTE